MIDFLFFIFSIFPINRSLNSSPRCANENFYWLRDRSREKEIGEALVVFGSELSPFFELFPRSEKAREPGLESNKEKAQSILSRGSKIYSKCIKMYTKRLPKTRFLEGNYSKCRSTERFLERSLSKSMFTPPKPESSFLGFRNYPFHPDSLI